MAWRLRRATDEKASIGLREAVAGLAPVIKPYWKHLAGYIAVSAVIVAARVVVPLIEGALVDAITRASLDLLVYNLLLYLAFTSARSLGVYARQVLNTYIGQSFIRDLRRLLYERIVGARLPAVRAEETGRLVSKVTNDVDTIGYVFTSDIINTFMDLSTMFFAAWAMVNLNLGLSLIVFSLVPPVLLVNVYFARKARRAYTKAREAIAKVMAKVEQGVSGAAVTKVFSQRKEYEKKEFRKAAYEYVESNVEAERAASGVGPATNIIAAVGMAAILFYGGLLVVEGSVTIGVLVAFISYLNGFFQPLQTLVFFYNTLQSTLAAAERVIGVLNLPQEDEGGDAVPLGPGTAALREVVFGYEEGQAVLNGVTLDVEKGITVIAGPTGSGKSTLLKLVPRFYDPWSGSVEVDGRENREYRLKALRRYAVYVPQEPLIFSGTVLENIVLFTDAERRDVEEIIDTLGLRGVFNTIPGGLDGRVEESGKNLSKGQRQAISLVRALAANPRILLLDEATSSLDPETEALVYRGLKRVVEERGITLAAVAHRLPAIAPLADKIYVVSQGRVVEEGTHEELVKRDGVYARLWESQSA